MSEVELTDDQIHNIAHELEKHSAGLTPLNHKLFDTAIDIVYDFAIQREELTTLRASLAAMTERAEKAEARAHQAEQDWIEAKHEFGKLNPASSVAALLALGCELRDGVWVGRKCAECNDSCLYDESYSTCPHHDTEFGMLPVWREGGHR